MIPAEQFLAHQLRIHRACLTVLTLPPAGPRGTYSLWPAYRHSWWDEGNEVSKLTAADITRRFIAAPRFVPTAREIDDCLPTLALMNGTPKRWKAVVRWRAVQLWYGKHISADDEDFAHLRGGWRGIARLTRCSHTTAQNNHRDAMLYAWGRALDPCEKRVG